MPQESDRSLGRTRRRRGRRVGRAGALATALAALALLVWTLVPEAESARSRAAAPDPEASPTTTEGRPTPEAPTPLPPTREATRPAARLEVRNAQGRPVAGAYLLAGKTSFRVTERHLEQARSDGLVSDADGHVAVANDLLTGGLASAPLVWHPDYLPRGIAALHPGEVRSVVLDRGAMLHALVVTTTGRPVAGATVTASLTALGPAESGVDIEPEGARFWRPHELGGPVLRAVSDEDGRLSLGPLAQKRHLLTVSLRGLPYIENHGVAAAPGPTPARIEVVEPHALVLRCRRPITHAYFVRVDAEPEWSRDTGHLFRCRVKKAELERRYPGAFVAVRLPKRPTSARFHAVLRHFGPEHGWTTSETELVPLSQLGEPPILPVASGDKLGTLILDVGGTEARPRVHGFRLAASSESTRIKVETGVPTVLPADHYRVTGNLLLPQRWIEDCEFDVKRGQTTHASVRMKHDAVPTRIRVVFPDGTPTTFAGLEFSGFDKTTRASLSGLHQVFPGSRSAKEGLLLWIPVKAYCEFRALMAGYEPVKTSLAPGKGRRVGPDGLDVIDVRFSRRSDL